MTVLHILDHQTDTILATSSMFYNDNHRETLKNEEVFDFYEPINSKGSGFLNKRNRVIIPVDDGFLKEFIIEKSIQVRDKIEVYTSASYFELMKAKPIAAIKLNSQTVQMIGEYILKDSEWSLGLIEFEGIKDIIFDEYTDPYSALKKVAAIFELELRFRIETKNNRVVGRYVDMIKRVGGWRGKEITSGKDLLNAKRTEFTQNIVTALIGIGQEKEDGTREVVTVANEAARLAWGRNGQHLWGIYEAPSDDGNEDMTVARLTELTSQELQKRISTVISWEVEGADIEHIFNREHEKVRLGDQVRVKVTDFNPPFYLDAQIISREGSIRNKTQKKYVLGDFIEYTKEEIRSIKRMLEKQIQKKLSETQVLDITYPKDTIDQKIDKAPITDDKFPDEIPPTPTGFEGSGLFKIIQLKWDYNTKSNIAAYEVYASQVNGFTPNATNLVWKGKTGGYNHEANINETWYFRIRSINYSGTPSEFTEQIVANTVQIKAEDIQPYVITNNLIAENAAIDFAKIGNVQITNAMIDTVDANKVIGKNFIVGNGMDQATKLIIFTDDNQAHYISSNQAAGFRVESSGSLSLAAGSDYGVYVKNAPLVAESGFRASGSSQFNNGLTVNGTLNATNVQMEGYSVLTLSEAMDYFSLNGHEHNELFGSSYVGFYVNGSQRASVTYSQLTMQGTVKCTAIDTSSDINLKTDVTDYTESALQKIMDTPIVSYRYKDEPIDARKTIGIIAQIAPDEVYAAGEDNDAVSLYPMITLSWKSIQELKEEADAQKVENIELKARLSEIEARLSKLESTEGV